MQLKDLEKEIESHKDLDQAKFLSRFFKTGEGQYSEGDKFLGIRVPVQRAIAKKYPNLPLKDIIKLLESPWHEKRLIALFLMERRYSKPTEDPGFKNKEQIVNIQEEVYKQYISNFAYINNWDLVDSSAHKIVGRHLYNRDRKILYNWVKSKNLWERRISIISTLYFIPRNDFDDTFALSEFLLKDTEDLIHKACGWMIREIYKLEPKIALDWIEENKLKMPRTMLRYAIEKVPENKRKQILNAR